MICDNVLEYIGHTPIVRLNRMNDPDAAEVLVKYEGLNVGGSIKTRTGAGKGKSGCPTPRPTRPNGNRHSPLL